MIDDDSETNTNTYSSDVCGFVAKPREGKSRRFAGACYDSDSALAKETTSMLDLAARAWQL
jgi:hypothetical protein